MPALGRILRLARRSTGSVAVIVIAGLGLSCQADRRERIPVYPNTQLFPGSCDAAWTHAVEVIARSGFRLMANDKEAGLASFVWTGSGDALQSAAEDPGRLALEPRSLSQSWKDLRVESAVLALAPDGRGCQARISVSYSAFRERFWRGSRVNLESTGLFEKQLLSEIASTLTGKRPPTAAAARSKPVAAAAFRAANVAITRAAKSAARGAAPAPGPEPATNPQTTVYRLPDPE